MELALWYDSSQELRRVPAARNKSSPYDYFACSGIFVTIVTAFEGVICASWSAAATWAFTAGALLSNHAALSTFSFFLFLFLLLLLFDKMSLQTVWCAAY